MRKYLLYFFLILFLILKPFITISQEDSVRYEGIRIGFDAGNLLINSAKGDKTEFTVLADYEFREDKYAVLETGYTLIEDMSDSTNTSLSGAFGLLGVNFNLYDRKKRLNDDILFVGFHYGFAMFNHDLSLAPGYSGEFSQVGKESLSAHWAEFVTGGKTELWFLKNVFVGLSVGAKLMVAKADTKLITPQAIPGFGNYSNGTALGFKWSISYRIPIRKVDIKERIEKNKKLMELKQEEKKLKDKNKMNKKNRRFK